MKRCAIAALAGAFTLSLSSTLAAAPAANPQRLRESAVQKERKEKHRRLMQVVGLAEALELSEAEALRAADVMRKFDERRQPIRDQVRRSLTTLERAAAGDSASYAQVDSAISRLSEAKSQIAKLDQEMFLALVADLRPEQRAKAVLFLGNVERWNGCAEPAASSRSGAAGVATPVGTGAARSAPAKAE